MATKRYKFEVTEELRKLKLIKRKTSEYIIKNTQLLKFLADKISPIVFPDKERPPVSTEDDFQILAGEINKKYPESTISTGKGKNSSYEITQSYLRNICYPDNTKNQKTVSLYRILKIYHYFLSLEMPQTPEIEIGFVSGEIIDSKYLNNIRRLGHIKAEQFYLDKQNEAVQWLGIINNFDFIRRNTEQIEYCILESFNTMRSSKVVAVITGSSGNGKSTLLRRIAKNLSTQNSIKILWLLDIEKFVDVDMPKIIEHKQQNYLVIIQDWFQVESFNNKIENFINEITRINNIRILIADRDCTDKIYLKQLYGNLTFNIDYSENSKVIEKALSVCESWTEIDLNEILSNKFDTSVYKILFVFSRNLKLNQLDSKIHLDYIGQFIETIRYDIKTLFKINPALAKAFYYYSWLRNLSYKYDYNRCSITLNSFYLIIGLFNEKENEFPYYDKDSLAWKILKNYLIVDTIKYCPSHIGIQYICSKNDILFREGICNSLINEIPEFTSSIALKIYKEIILKGDVNSAFSIEYQLNKLDTNFGYLGFTDQIIKDYYDLLVDKFYNDNNRFFVDTGSLDLIIDADRNIEIILSKEFMNLQMEKRYDIYDMVLISLPLKDGIYISKFINEMGITDEMYLRNAQDN